MKRTRNSLLVSGLSLVLTVAVMLSATFAWFTDSVTNPGNTIQAGKLDIKAYVQDVNPSADTTYTIDGVNSGNPFGFAAEKTDVETMKTGIISEENWEPGISNAKLLTVENAGSLDAKVKVDFTITTDDLVDVLWYDFILVDGSEVKGEFTERPMSTIETYPETVEIPVAAEDSVSFILVYGMDEEAGNEYQGKSFAGYVNILAAQYTSEKDGFGSDQYDKDAAYPDKTNPGSTVTDEIDKIDTNGTVNIPEGVTDLTGGLPIPSTNTGGENVSITLQGATDDPADSILDLGSGGIVFGGTKTDSSTLSMFSLMDALNDQGEDNGRTLVVKNLTIRTSGIGVKFDSSAPGVPSEGLTIRLENCIVEGLGENAFGVLMGTGTKNSVLQLVDTKFVNQGTALAIADNGNSNDFVSGPTGNTVQMSGVTFENCGSQYQLFNPSVYYANTDAVSEAGLEAMARFNNVFTINGKKLLLTVNNAEELLAALAVGGDVVLKQDITVSTDNVKVPEGVTVSIDLGGNTLTVNRNSAILNYGTITSLTNGSIVGGQYYGIYNSGRIDLLNVNVKASGSNSMGAIYNEGYIVEIAGGRYLGHPDSPYSSTITASMGLYNCTNATVDLISGGYFQGSSVAFRNYNSNGIKSVTGGFFDCPYMDSNNRTFCDASTIGNAFYNYAPLSVSGGTWYNIGNKINNKLADNYKLVRGDVCSMTSNKSYVRYDSATQVPAHWVDDESGTTYYYYIVQQAN